MTKSNTRIIKEPEDNPSLANPPVPTLDVDAAARNRERIEAEKDNKMVTPYRSRGYHAWYERQQGDANSS